jgi:hypothetical protein
VQTSLFNKIGEPVAYISDDFNHTIYLWDGTQVAYLFQADHVYGTNGKHLGRFIENVLYDERGLRIGFTSNSCPVPIGKEPIKPKKQSAHEIRPRWNAPPLPKLSYHDSEQDLEEFLKQGRISLVLAEASTEEGEESSD